MRQRGVPRPVLMSSARVHNGPVQEQKVQDIGQIIVC